MKFEYALFNLIVITGPMIMSFIDQKIAFRRKFPQTFLSMFLPLLIFCFWDAIVTNTHWYFEESRILGIKIFSLPLEEILFFVTVPFASLFIWANSQFLPESFHIVRPRLAGISWFLVAMLPVGIILYAAQNEYTGLCMMMLSVASLLDMSLKINIFRQTRTYVFLVVVSLCNAIFNGYLTARPIVTYNDSLNVGIRLGTIPIEDFFYGTSMIILSVIINEALQRKQVSSGL